jgi:phosphopantothenoylcysteine decarboxylase
MAKVLLGVTGSVAAIKTPEVFAELRRRGHQVKVVATNAALYFFDPAAIAPPPFGPSPVAAEGRTRQRDRQLVVLDEDEWPGRENGRRYQRSDDVLHIELRRWAELLVIAPLDANTLAKLANGLCDNCLTCVWRAWDPTRPVLLAPAMNTFMWEHPLTMRHLRQLAGDAGAAPPPDLSVEELPAWINSHCPKLRLVAPVSRQLACGDVGVGAMASPEEIGAAVDEAHALAGV